MKKKLFIFLYVCSLCLASCGQDSDEKDNKALLKGSSFSYSYSPIGCETGEHSFNNLKEMCLALADDELNNSCAANLRCHEFLNRCDQLALDVTCEYEFFSGLGSKKSSDPDSEEDN